MKKYFVYILKCSDNSFYIGVTNDILSRENQHNEGLNISSYTFARRPVKLVWCQEFLNPTEAIHREKQLKGWSRKKKEALIQKDYDSLRKYSRNSLRQAQTDKEKIMEKLPYSHPFLFVDKLLSVNGEGAEGTFTFHKDSYFYQGHFKDNPVTPGVILTECCAQIGLVCLGIYLLGKELDENAVQIAMASSEMDFLAPVFPGETVQVVSERVYFRFGKLKCRVRMFNAQKKMVCKGVLSGMFKQANDE
nr:GIY-YIG nuclease family protein [Allomuricauda sp.]